MGKLRASDRQVYEEISQIRYITSHADRESILSLIIANAVILFFLDQYLRSLCKAFTALSQLSGSHQFCSKLGSSPICINGDQHMADGDRAHFLQGRDCGLLVDLDLNVEVIRPGCHLCER